MTGFVRTTWLVALQSLRILLGSKKSLFFFGLSLLYAGVMALVVFRFGDREGVNELFSMLTLIIMVQALMPLTAMYLSISAIRDEISERSIVFLLSAPVPRPAIWLGKYLAATVSSLVIIGVGFFLAAILSWNLQGDLRFGAQLQASTVSSFGIGLLVAPFAYCAIGSFFALSFKRAMIWGAVFVFAWESFAGSTPAQSGVRSATVVDAIRSIAIKGSVAATGFRREMADWITGGRLWMDGMSPEAVIDKMVPSIPHSIWNVLLTALIYLGLALLIGSRKDYESGEQNG
ncbi:MAG TPA: ABC transporter permease [Planctomycetes bacterium]|nr:ABC transporter permease [Planctomycetota bacterium]